MVRLYIIICIGIVLLQSCSVKEDRIRCPCWMSVDIANEESTSNAHNDGNIFLRMRCNADPTLDWREFQMTQSVSIASENLEYEVPRGAVGVSAVNHARLNIPIGEQMDSLYGFFKMFNTRCESTLCKVKLHKEFCTLSFVFGRTIYQTSYKIEVHSNVNGVSEWDLLPLEGKFKFAPTLDNGTYSVRVPRQIDNSMEVLLLYKDEIVERLPIGEYIARSGYDWSAESLSDIHLKLDLESLIVTVSVSDWNEVVVMEIEI